MTRWFVFDTLTGTELTDFTAKADSTWSVRANEAEDVQVTIPLTDPRMRALDWQNLAAEWKSSIAVEEHGRFYGGPIQPHTYDGDKDELKLTAKGLWKYFDHRKVLPPAAEFTSLVLPSGLPDPSLDTNLSGLDYGTIAKRIVQQACAWPGANLPIVYQDDRAGTRIRNYPAVDLKEVGTVLAQLTEVINGPDIRFQLRRRDATHFEWFMETGTETQPRLQSPIVQTWDLGAEALASTNLSVTSDPSEMADVSWAAGGRNDDRVLMAMARSTKLRDAGYPLLELADTSHSDVVLQATLDDYAAEGLRTGYLPAKFWTFKVRADRKPYLADYSVGDLVDVTVARSGYLKPRPYRRRIAALSGDAKGDWITITTGAIYDG